MSFVDAFYLPRTGVVEFDQDHIRLLELADAIHLGVRNGDAPAAIAAFEEAEALLCEHFRREEGFLRQWRYPKLEQHADGHRDALRSVSLFGDRLRRFDDPAALLKEVEGIIARALAMLVEEDLDYKLFLQDRGYPLRLEDEGF